MYEKDYYLEMGGKVDYIMPKPPKKIIRRKNNFSETNSVSHLSSTSTSDGSHKILSNKNKDEKKSEKKEESKNTLEDKIETTLKNMSDSFNYNYNLYKKKTPFSLLSYYYCDFDFDEIDELDLKDKYNILKKDFLENTKDLINNANNKDKNINSNNDKKVE